MFINCTVHTARVSVAGSSGAELLPSLSSASFPPSACRCAPSVARPSAIEPGGHHACVAAAHAIRRSRHDAVASIPAAPTCQGTLPPP
eukprot:3181067-Rhodomonas_salina.2